MNLRNTLYAAVALVGLGTGCTSADKSSFQEFFPPAEAESRAINRFCNTQAASEARFDGTLGPKHFDGENLNSLGTAKLDLMLRDDDTARPVVVYMNLDKDQDLKGRRDAVVTYLTDHGLNKDQIEFKAGFNPNNGSFAAGQLSRLPKTESGGTGAESWSTDSSASSGTAGTTNK